MLRLNLAVLAGFVVDDEAVIAGSKVVKGIASMLRSVFSVSFSTCLICIVALGCGSSDNGRVPIQGKITLEGEPVKYGSISLRPANGASGLSSGADIQDGNFEIPAKTGPTIGQYSARVTIPDTDERGNARFGSKMKTIEAEIEILADKKKYEIELSKAAEFAPGARPVTQGSSND